MWKEFKEFAVKGNAIDLAVGVVIGAAFGGIVTSLVKDIIMPPIGYLTGGLDFSNMFLVLKPSGATVCHPGRCDKGRRDHVELRKLHHRWHQFPDRRVCDFHGGKGINKMKRPAPTAAPVSKDCPFCAMTIPIKATRCPHCTSEMSGTARA